MSFRARPSNRAHGHLVPDGLSKSSGSARKDLPVPDASGVWKELIPVESP